MEKYYEMFRGKNQANKKAFWTVPTAPTTRTTTRTQMGELDLGEVGVCVRRSKLYKEPSLSFTKIKQSVIYQDWLLGMYESECDSEDHTSF